MKKIFIIFLIIPVLISSCEKKTAGNSDSNSVISVTNSDQFIPSPIECVE
ncbi:hypothetical protein [Silvanigrella paludirubra]|nr:hypothetical protein [Silvanigrella paludirubra]